MVFKTEISGETTGVRICDCNGEIELPAPEQIVTSVVPPVITIMKYHVLTPE